MQIGFIGLGKMGSRMAGKLVAEGHELVVWNRSEEGIKKFKEKTKSANFKIAATIEELVKSLRKPGVIWSMLPAGEATDSMMEEISKHLAAGDIVVDGGNSKYTDTELRHETFKKLGVRFLGIGVSGGVIAETQGYPLMAGGDMSAYEEIKPVLESLATPHGGYEYFGEGGAGHFVKMVHNAIEYGYMQAIGEGFGVLENSEYDFDLVKVAKLYTKGTLVSGFMMERTVEALAKDPELGNITGIIGRASGETVWTVEEAHKSGLFIENIEQALGFRNRSEEDRGIQDSFAAKLICALRNVFGGHEITKR